MPAPASCTAGFKIKIVRKSSGTIQIMAERGPFPVQQDFTTVTLTPPIPVQEGDFLAVVQLQDTTICGSVGAANGGPADTILRYSGIDHPNGSFATGGSLNSGTALMAQASSEPNPVAAMLPVVGSTAGGLTFFRTDVQAINPGGLPAKGKLVFRPAGGVGSPSDPSVDYTYDDLEVTSITDVVAFMGRTGLGSLDIIPSSGVPPRLVARIYSDNGTAGTAGFTMESLAPHQALRRNATYLLLAPADLTAFRMNVGVRTLDEGLTILIAGFGASVTRSYAANHFEQGTIAAFLGTQPVTNGLYRVLVQSGGAFIYSTTTDNRTNDTSVRFLTLGQ